VQGTEVRTNIKFAQTVNKVLKAFYWAGIAALLLVVLLGLFALFGPDRYFAAERYARYTFTFELNGIIRYHPDPEQVAGGSLRGLFRSIALGSAVYVLFFLYLLRRLRQVMDTVAAQKPFYRGNSKRIHEIGRAVLASAFLIPGANSFVAWKMIRTFNLSELSILYTPDLKLAFTGLLLLILAWVFDYGGYLQEEMDQTV